MNDDIIEYEFTDVLDLHCFSPKDLKILLDDYINFAFNAKWQSVRIIHGKGKGILRDRTLSIIRKHPHVLSFKTASEDAGGWGSVIVTLKNKI